MHNGNISPKCIPEGTVDMYGEALNLYSQVTGTIENVYREYGFDLLRTPILEHAEVFKGHHGEGEKSLFRIRDKQSHDLVLRYDLTVPLARYLSQNQAVPIPFKRYQIATVCRDNMNNGHLREFTQCDADIVGTSDMMADVEIISTAYTGLSKLGFRDFVINVNHRGIINAIYEKAELLHSPAGRTNLQETLNEIHRFSETWEHHGNPRYQSSFEKNISTIIKKHKLPTKALEVVKFITSVSGDFKQKISILEDFFRGLSEAIYGIEELKEIVSYLDPEVKEKVNLDISLVREFDYYTGFILEGNIHNIPVGAVLGGGRFDNLVRSFGGRDLPAVGMAFDLERIIASLGIVNVSVNTCLPTRIIVVPKSREEKTKLLNVARKLRQEGMNVDYTPMVTHSEGEVMDYVKKRGFSVLITNDSSGIKVLKVGNEKDLGDLLKSISKLVI